VNDDKGNKKIFATKKIQIINAR